MGVEEGRKERRKSGVFVSKMYLQYQVVKAVLTYRNHYIILLVSFIACGLLSCLILDPALSTLKQTKHRPKIF